MSNKLVPSKLAIIIQQGKVLDFIDGKMQRNETPEEYVRQEIAKSLVREYRYDKAHIEVEFTVKVGSRKPRADLVIFMPGCGARPGEGPHHSRVQGSEDQSHGQEGGRGPATELHGGVSERRLRNVDE